MALSGFRARRERCKRYAYGRQWEDTIAGPNGPILERDFMIRQGNFPLQNNLIRKLVRNVLGVFRNRYAIPSPSQLGLSDSPDHKATYKRIKDMAAANSLEEVLARAMEEFLLSGMAVLRKSPASPLPSLADTAPAGMVRTDYVSPANFFVDISSRDFRGWDASLIGEFHSRTLAQVVTSLARSAEEAEQIASLYGGSPTDRCTVVEVWHKDVRRRYRVHDPATAEVWKMEEDDWKQLPEEERSRYNSQWLAEEVWRYAFYTPDGRLLREGDSPYADGGHPYIWRAYPFIDGEIHSFVEDVIDQQRFTNRLISMYDWAVRSSAKGVLLFPIEAIPKGAEVASVMDAWSRSNGVIMYKSKDLSHLPQQVNGGVQQAGIAELLNIQLKMFEDVSGVNQALQGNLDSNSTSGTLYRQQMRQALVSLEDLLSVFDSLILDSFRRDLALTTA